MSDQPLQGSFPSFRNLQVVEAVAQYGNLSRAAVSVHMSQPAVTQAVLKIEEWSGVKLFQRSWTGMSLTREGRILLTRVGRLLDQVETALTRELYPNRPKKAVRAIMGRLKSVHINVLVAASGSSSFDEAAQRLAYSRTTVQRTARELERIFGHNLYERTADGLVTNETARRLAVALPRACRELYDGVEEIAVLRGKMRQRLFIGAQRLVCSSLLASAINHVLSIHPDAEVKIIEGSYRQLLHELRSGRIDLSFGALELPSGVVDVIEEPLFHEPYCVACRQGHPLLSETEIDLDKLARFGWVLPGSESQRSRAFDRMFGKESRPKSRLMISSLNTQVSILANSDRLTLLPRLELALEPQFSSLAALPFEAPVARLPDGLTVRTDWVANPVQSCFCEYLRHCIRELGLSLSSEIKLISAFKAA